MRMFFLNNKTDNQNELPTHNTNNIRITWQRFFPGLKEYDIIFSYDDYAYARNNTQATNETDDGGLHVISIHRSLHNIQIKQ
mmetsp:Transcript_4710/g.5653  ORF Transcript_4710/g.5653 Transcript_4710/m.5653 type:complete len:82 (+) Transcript_4710:176-421(+)